MTDGTYLEVGSLSKRFGASVALADVSFAIPRGEFVCFLGPSGCGKTTLLRCIAGLETQTSGTIRQDGRDISRLPPSERDFGIVFQSYALFPNLTASENVAFGLASQRRPRSEIAERVRELIAIVGLAGHEEKYPAQLSGGQQQRVALARALATSPGLLLLDEPLSALDAKVRARLRREIRSVQKRLGVTTIMVTHDQEEAQTMADRILVMRDGRVEQIGPPGEIYERPATPFVADFIGVMNFLDGVVEGPGIVSCQGQRLKADTTGFANAAAVMLAIRPEDVTAGAAGTENVVPGTLRWAESLGPFVRLNLTTPSGDTEIWADVGKRHEAYAVGATLPLHLPPHAIRLYRRPA